VTITINEYQANTYAQRNAAYWRRNLAVCLFGSFTTLVSLSMLLPFLPLYVHQLGVNDPSAIVQWSGVAFSATFLATAITAPFWGILADRFGRKPMLIRAAVGMTIVMSLIGVAHSITELVILRFIAGLIGGYASAAIVMVGTQAPADRAGWALGLLSTGALSGNLIGPLVGGFLPALIGIRGTFFAGGGLIGITAILSIFVLREDFRSALDSKRRVTTAATAPLTNNRAIAVLMLAAMMVLLANMSIEPIITVYVSQLDVPRTHLVQFAGFIMACSAFGSIVTAARIGALADRIGGWRVVTGCLLLSGMVVLPQSIVTSWWQLAVLRCLMGMTIAGVLPSIAKLIRHSVSDSNAGKTLGWLQSAQFSGQVIGPLMGGAVGVHLGMQAVFVVTGLLLIALAGLTHFTHPVKP
jgi:MFS family permease